MIIINCSHCKKLFSVSRSRFDKNHGQLCCSRNCASKYKKDKFKKDLQEKLQSLGEKLCSCGCGQIIKPFYRDGTIVFNKFIHGHNLDEKMLEISHKYSKEICSRRMKKYNKTVTPEQRKAQSTMAGITLSKRIKEGIVKIWSKGKNKNNNETVFRLSQKLIGRDIWNEGKDKYSDERIRQYGLKTRGRTKAKGFIAAIKSSERMKKNNPIRNPEIRNKMILSNEISPNKPEKIIINKNYPGLKFTGNWSFWVDFKDGKSKNPDFIVIPFEHQKKVIEVWGEYWHRNDNSSDLVKKYDEIGIKCLILPYQTIKNGQFDNIIQDFICT